MSHYSLLGMNLFQTAFLNNPGLLRLSDMVNILRAAWVDRGEGGAPMPHSDYFTTLLWRQQVESDVIQVHHDEVRVACF